MFVLPKSTSILCTVLQYIALPQHEPLQSVPRQGCHLIFPLTFSEPRTRIRFHLRQGYHPWFPLTNAMQRQAAAKIDRQIGGADTEIPQAKERVRVDTTPPDFEPYKPKYRKSGTGCVTMINDHLFEGRYSPRNAYGKREAHNIYAKTREECEEKLAAMIVQVKADIKAEKERLKAMNESFSLEMR